MHSDTEKHHGHDMPAPSHLNNPGKLDSKLILFVGVVGSLLVAVIFWATEAFYRNVATKDLQNVAWTQPDRRLAEYLADQNAKLAALKANPGGKTAVIPIDKAMEIYAAGGAK
jgi:hypothetical protein